MRKYLKNGRQEYFEGEISEIERGNTMEHGKILETLINCGLSEYESRAYSSLVFLGPSKARTISKESNVPQSKIYEVLDQLMNKQLVEVFDGRPKEFKATNPEIALKNILDERTKEIENLKNRVEILSDFLKPKKQDEIIGGIWTIKGEKFKEFFNKTAEMLERAEDYVYAITRDFSRSSVMSTAVKKSIKNGVKIRVLGMEQISKKNYYKALWYKNQGISLKIFETKVHPRIIVVDGKEILLRLDHTPDKRVKFKFNSLWSEDPSLVNVIDSYVKNIWKSSTNANFSNYKF
jgi:sugar-specific transcriptional regulator TrmB